MSNLQSMLQSGMLQSSVCSCGIIPNGSYLSNFVIPWTDDNIITLDVSDDDISISEFDSFVIPPVIFLIELITPTGIFSPTYT